MTSTKPNFLLNKSVLTNLTAIAIICSSYLFLDYSDLLMNAGLFALSGAVTNWLAIHMLFEKVPGLYGSGIIPNRFEEFKSGIQDLIMGQFFSKENIDRFFSDTKDHHITFDLTPILEDLDYEQIYEKMIAAILETQLAPLLQMMGGEKALEPMKPKFISKIKEALISFSEDPAVNTVISNKIKSTLSSDRMMNQVENIVTNRLNELTPKMVKEIIQEMIREHLGWLVVWGGVFGGAIGGISTLVLM